MRAFSRSISPECSFSSASLKMDALQNSVVNNSLNLSEMASMTLGSFAFSLLRSQLMLPQVLSMGFSVFAEVSAYRSCRQIFSRFDSDNHQENIFDSRGFISDYFDFSFLKGIGFLFKSSGFLSRHFVSGLGLSAANKASQALNISEKTNESFAENFANSFMHSCMLESSMQIFHSISGGKIHFLERSMQRRRASISELSSLRTRKSYERQGLPQNSAVLELGAAALAGYALLKTRVPGLNWKPNEISGTQKGYFGDFEIVKRGNVTFFEMKAADGVPKLGTQIYIGGYGTDHTAFAELPYHMAQRGWDVKIAVFPFYENFKEFPSVRGGGFTPFLVSRYWLKSMDVAIESLIRELPNHEKILLGGFSLGAGAAIGCYTHLSPDLRIKVSSLCIGGSSFIMKRVDWNRLSLSHAIFHAYMTTQSFFDRDMGRGHRPQVAPELDWHVRNLQDKSWFGAYATYLTYESYTDRLKSGAQKVQVPVVYLHGAESDQHVSPKNRELLYKLIGPYLVEEPPSEDGHWVYCSRRRWRYFERIHRVASGDSTEPQGNP